MRIAIDVSDRLMGLHNAFVSDVFIMETRLSCECDISMLHTVSIISVYYRRFFRGGKFSKLSKAETEIDLNPDETDTRDLRAQTSKDTREYIQI